METNLRQLRCGGCGEKSHELYLRENGEIISECVECKSQSEIVVPKPQVTIRHNSGLGTICIFDR